MRITRKYQRGVLDWILVWEMQSLVRNVWRLLCKEYLLIACSYYSGACRRFTQHKMMISQTRIWWCVLCSEYLLIAFSYSGACMTALLLLSKIQTALWPRSCFNRDGPFFAKRWSFFHEVSYHKVSQPASLPTLSQKTQDPLDNSLKIPPFDRTDECIKVTSNNNDKWVNSHCWRTIGYVNNGK